MKSKKFLAILSRYIWPIDGGRKESLSHYLKEIHDNYNYEIKVLCFLEGGQTINRNDLPYYISDVIELKQPEIKEKIDNIVTKSFSKEYWPFQCSLYYSKTNDKIISNIINYWKPDVVFTEMIRTCVYYEAIKRDDIKLLANLDDLLSIRYLRQAKKNNNANITGVYSKRLPKFANKLINNRIFKNVVLNMESKRCCKWEQEYYKLYDYTLMTSDKERDILNTKMKDKKAKTLSVGVDVNYYSEDIKIKKDPVGIAIHGNFSSSANADSLNEIITKILPMVKSKYNFYVVGNCPKEISDKYKNNKNIYFIGRVDDFRCYIKKASIYLAPMSYGTGIKTKIIEAMAMSLPVVTNSTGVEGINARNKKEIIVEDDYSKLAYRVDELLNNKEMREYLTKNAKKFVFEHFRWDVVFSVFKEMNL